MTLNLQLTYIFANSVNPFLNHNFLCPQDNTSDNANMNGTSKANLSAENVDDTEKKAKAVIVEKKPVKTIQEAIIRQVRFLFNYNPHVRGITRSVSARR